MTARDTDVLSVTKPPGVLSADAAQARHVITCEQPGITCKGVEEECGDERPANNIV